MQRKHFALKLAIGYPKLSNLKRKGDLSYNFGDQKSKQNAANVQKARSRAPARPGACLTVIEPDDIMSRSEEITQ